MGKAEIEGCAGVALFGKSQEADLAAFEWAYEHLHLSKKYKLWIIHVNENANPTGERPGHSFLSPPFLSDFMPYIYMYMYNSMPDFYPYQFISILTVGTFTFTYIYNYWYRFTI
jgi:hypothetical protein